MTKPHDRLGEVAADDLVYECLMLNHPWSEGEEVLRAGVKWPECEGYMSARQFVVFRREEEGARGG